MVGWFRRVRPSIPPLRWSLSVSVGLRFFFSLAFSGFARSGPGVLVLVFSLCSSSLLLRSPSRVPVKQFSSHLHAHFTFIAGHPHLHFMGFSHPAVQGVCLERLHRRKTSRWSLSSFYIFYIKAGGHRGPGGSVTNEDTPRGPC